MSIVQIVASVLLLLIPVFLIAQKIDLHHGWKFRKGDNPDWALKAIDDSQWMRIGVDSSWERCLKEDYDGYGWYRIKFVVPATMKAATKHKQLALFLGRIDDVDEVFINGTKVGTSGKFPPESQSAWTLPRVYIVPDTLIIWGEENTLSVRVYDSGGGGGLYEGPYEFRPFNWTDEFVIQYKYPNTQPEFEQNTPFYVTLHLENNAKAQIKGKLVCQIYDFNHKVLLQEKQTSIIIKKKDSGKVNMQFDGLPKGFYKLKTILTAQTGEQKIYEEGIAISPTLMTSPPTLPNDFDAFWNNTKADLARIAPNYKIYPQPMWSNERINTYMVEMQSLNNAKIRGWLSIPKGKTSLPALLKVQGYSSYMMPDTTMDDFVVLALNIRGHGNSREDINPGFPGFLWSGLESAQHYIYRGAFVDGIRAIDFLQTLSEVDTSRIAVEGGSQGGALSIAIAALDKRVKVCLPDVPFLSDFRNYFQIATWPADEFSAYQAQHKVEWEKIYGVLDYFDIKNLAPRITCPVYMGVGLLDEVCPPQINFAAFNNLKSNTKAYYLYANAGHSLPWQVHPPRKMEWLRAQFGMRD